MNKIHNDLIVIGDGPSGLLAALKASENGQKVLLIKRGEGSLSISSGCIDLLGYLEGKRLEDPWSQLSNLPTQHPYRLLGSQNIQNALEWLQKLLQKQNYFLQSQNKNGKPCNTLLPTVFGTLKPSYLIPEEFISEPLFTAHKVLVVGIDGFRDCSPALVGKQLQQYASLAQVQFMRAILPNPFASIQQRPVSALDLARFVDTKRGLEWLITALGKYAGEYDVILLPPICGTKTVATVIKTLKRTLHCHIEELLTIPPGVGGWRMFEILRKCVNEAGIRVLENATCIGAEIDNQHCVAVITDNAGKHTRHVANSFIVATGGILGGGISMLASKAEENIFKIRIALPPVSEACSEKDVFAKQAFANLGVQADNSLRAIDSNGQILFDNVFFAGRILGGYDAAVEKSGGGVAVATGYYAACLAGAINARGNNE